MTTRPIMAARPAPSALEQSAAPRYRKIEAILRDQIFTGELSAGDRVPTEEELVRDFRVSRPTVRRALEILEQDNLIIRKAGRGTFVNAIAEELPARRNTIALGDLVDLDGPAKIVIQRQGTLAARGAVQSALGVPFGEEVFYFVRIYYRNGQPLGGAKVYLPRALGRQLTRKDMAAPRFIDALAHRAGRPIVDAEFRLEAVLADARTGEIFRANPGAPMLSIRRISRDAKGTAVEHSHLLFRSDRCQIGFRQRRSPSSKWTVAV
ncbi:MAG: GntR family transcriptional regulator [Rhodospirillaceae bacterium]|nr:GntR family transcriptional regulator [Rhodospirillaceae bacterium]